MKSNLLYEVIPIRLFLIVSLVLYHAFAIFSGSWAPIKGYHNIDLYDTIAKLAYTCLLETFVFISGYILGYQAKTKGVSAIFQTKIFFSKKFKRLIIPSILFSLIYIISLGNSSNSIIILTYKIISGVGHMWFLPMLFWCFTIVYLFEQFSVSIKYIFPLLFISMFMSALPLPLRINSALYYIIFFYIGYYIQKNNINLNINSTLKISIFIVFFLLLFVFKLKFNIQPLINNIQAFTYEYIAGVGGGYITDNQILKKTIITFTNIFFRFICASTGIILLMNLSTTITKNFNIIKKTYILKLSECCFGVYIFQQFILKFLNQSQLPYIINEYLYPWVIFIVTMITSLTMTIVIKKTKLGKKLL